MKKNFYSTCLILFLTVLFINCSDNEIHEFSHDDEINRWVKENKKQILTYNRKDIKNFSIAKQRAILQALPAKKRKLIWQEKINYILNLKLSEEETAYLKWFEQAFKKINYEVPTSKDFSNEMYDKVMIGAKEFNWSSEFIYLTFFTIADLKANVRSNITAQKISGEPDTCTCYYNGGCSGWNNTCSEPDVCKKANTDCGVFGSTGCDAYCTGDITIN